MFVGGWSLAQIMPGPNVVKLGLMIGGRYFGLRGGPVALAARLAAPLVVVILLSRVYSRFADNAHLAAALRGMGAVAAGLITATGLKLLAALRTHPLGLAACLAFGVATFVAVAILRFPLAWVLI